MRRSALLLPLLLSVLLAGCTGPDDGPIGRDRLAFPVASSVGGVNATASGDVPLVGGDGVVVERAQNGTALSVGLAAVAQTRVFQACAGPCVETQVPQGVVLADAGLVSLRNLSLNALGPAGDSAVFFHADGQETGRFLRWTDSLGRFQLNDDVQAIGNVTGTGHVGTTTPLALGGGPGAPVVTISTAATQGLESTIFLRGSAQLSNSTAIVPFPDAFQALVGDGPITAQVTLTSRGPTIFVSEKTSGHIAVEAVEPGSSATFDYFVQAVRKGGEAFEV